MEYLMAQVPRSKIASFTRQINVTIIRNDLDTDGIMRLHANQDGNQIYKICCHLVVNDTSYANHVNSIITNKYLINNSVRH